VGHVGSFGTVGENLGGGGKRKGGGVVQGRDLFSSNKPQEFVKRRRSPGPSIGHKTNFAFACLRKGKIKGSKQTSEVSGKAVGN